MGDATIAVGGFAKDHEAWRGQSQIRHLLPWLFAYATCYIIRKVTRVTLADEKVRAKMRRGTLAIQHC